MRIFIKNILSVFISLLVILLSVGVNISELHCGESAKLFLGDITKSCNDYQDMTCCIIDQPVTCCSVEKECSSENSIDCCSSETELIAFDFETLIESNRNILLFVSSIFLFNQLYLNLDISDFSHINYTPPTYLFKPLFIQIQSFLL